MGCAQGHPWTAESTIDRPGRARECRLCARARGKAWAQKKAAEKRLQRAEPQPKAFVKCAIADCPEGAKVKGWCNVHYQRWHRYGDPLVQKRIHGDDDRNVPFDQTVELARASSTNSTMALCTVAKPHSSARSLRGVLRTG